MKFLIQKMKMILTHIGAWAPMAEQKAVAKYLINEPAVNNYLTNIKTEFVDEQTHGWKTAGILEVNWIC